ncbi:aspartate--tRNA ligase [Candidatus Pacearchaeota archaeon]|nr:aspartate--tRNA ligase [Candidatus Pacearchaeota archaeon]
MLRTHKISELNEKLDGKRVSLAGWADTVRAHGKVIFIDLRDRYGKVQCVIGKECKDFEKAKTLTKESCVIISGEVKKRPKGAENKDISTGNVEVSVEKIEIENGSKAIPFDFSDENVNEEVRLKYRFLDLRGEKLQRAIMLRHKIIKSMRDFLSSEGFIEIETPLLAKSTPEGARDYIVPSRVNPGKFYALPQSPQLFKQLLMVAGFDRYFQIARCLRDEDLRADRQPEFTQLDVEMSFVDEEDIYACVEGILKYVMKEVFNIEIKTPFPRMPYDEAMKKHNSDKPDLRKDKSNPDELAFSWIVNFPMFEYSKEDKKIVAAHHPFCMPDDIKNIKKEPLKLRARTYDLVLNGTELLSGSIRVHKPEIQREIFEVLGLDKKETEEKFGFLLDAFSYGAPPHGGFAIGLDRLIQILTKTSSIREVIAFPKNQEAKDVMLDAPSAVSEKQLKEANIKLDLPKKKK